MKKPKRPKGERSLPATPYETFASALGRPIDSVEVRRVIDALGGIYEVCPLEPSVSSYDPDSVRTVAWDFPSAPPANRWAATNMGVREDTVVWMTLSPALIDGVISDQTVSLRLPDGDEEIFRPQGTDWNWAPAIIRRGSAFLPGSKRDATRLKESSHAHIASSRSRRATVRAADNISAHG